MPVHLHENNLVFYYLWKIREKLFDCCLNDKDNEFQVFSVYKNANVNLGILFIKIPGKLSVIPREMTVSGQKWTILPI